MSSAVPNQLILTGTFAANRLAVAPVAGQVIADSGQLPAGVYSVQVAGTYGGTADAIDNMEVWINNDRLTSLPVAPVANATPMWLPLPGVVVFQGGRVQVKAIAAGGVGSVFRGTIIATPVRTLNIT